GRSRTEITVRMTAAMMVLRVGFLPASSGPTTEAKAAKLTTRKGTSVSGIRTHVTTSKQRSHATIATTEAALERVARRTSLTRIAAVSASKQRFATTRIVGHLTPATSLASATSVVKSMYIPAGTLCVPVARDA